MIYDDKLYSLYYYIKVHFEKRQHSLSDNVKYILPKAEALIGTLSSFQ